MQLTFWNDPGHGWLETTYDELVTHKIQDKISRCSYRQGNRVFLEEDCDAAHLVNALKEFGEVVVFEDIYREDIFIRNLPSYYRGY